MWHSTVQHCQESPNALEDVVVLEFLVLSKKLDKLTGLIFLANLRTRFFTKIVPLTKDSIVKSTTFCETY